jgi:hypothetical protein
MFVNIDIMHKMNNINIKKHIKTSSTTDITLSHTERNRHLAAREKQHPLLWPLAQLHNLNYCFQTASTLDGTNAITQSKTLHYLLNNKI